MTASADPVSTAPTASSDAQLIAEVRAGDNEAYARLFERHHTAAVGLARRYARNASDAEDLASEGFANVLTALRSGSGPDAFFRAYLFTSISRLAARGNIKAGRQTLSDEMERYEGEQLYDDPVMAGFESDAVAIAFRTLPERWQAVLWYTEVDGMQPAAVAPLLGLSPNAVSALALRAREGLRQAYLQAHVSAAAVDDACAPFADKLGAYTRNGLSSRKEKQVREHLADCPRCTAALLQLEDVGHGMRGIIFPLVTAVPFAAPAAGKLVAGGLLTGGAAWLKRTADKVGPANLVVIGVAAVTVLAGGIAFAGLGQPTAQGPPAAATAPSAAASSGTGSGGGAGAGAAKEVAPTPLPPSPAPAPEDSPAGP
ncbi:MAG: sigma-70 family RNA polymerase sigma factor, partial [Sinomonas sp.]|nr:sigma-70 family RNA polymerase sigma factor [Sinomonas sp.]